MKNVFVFLLLFLANLSVDAQKKSKSATRDVRLYMDMITADELSASLHFLASDQLEGRRTGTQGQVTAAWYLASALADLGVVPVVGSSAGSKLGRYFQEFPFERGKERGKSQNVVGIIEGSDPSLSKEYILLSAHYDHLGKDTALAGDQIFNGAADDGSGVVALLEIAESIVEAKKAGKGPKRSIVIVFFSGEEMGLVGSTFYCLESPLIPLERLKAVINLDGVGGVDPSHPSKSTRYVYILQTDSTSKVLGDKARKINSSTGINLNVEEPLHPETFRSDHQPFQYMLIPSIYFSTGLTEHYHKVTDEPGT